MTNPPSVNRSHAPDPVVIRTPSKNREIAGPNANAVELHREEQTTKEDASATEEVYTCMKNACKGAVYDAQHFADLPGKTNMEKMSVVMCRGGRFPYLLLTFAIGFFCFFLVYKSVSAVLAPSSSAASAGMMRPQQTTLPNLPRDMMVGPPIL